MASIVLVRDMMARFNFSIFGNLECKVDFTRPLFLRPGVELLDNRIYIAGEEEGKAIIQPEGFLFARKLHSVLFFTGQKPGDLLTYFEATLIFDGASLFDIYDAWEAEIARFVAWDADIDKILLETGDIQAVLRRSEGVFGNPLYLENMEFPRLQNGEFHHPENVESPQLPQIDKNEVNNLCFDIFKGSKLRYRLFLLEASRQIYTSDNTLLEHLGFKIHRFIESQSIESGSAIPGLSNILKRLLLGDSGEADLSALEAAQARLGKNADGDEQEFFCIVIKPVKPDIVSENDIKRICSGAAEIVKALCAFEYEGGIVAAAPVQAVRRGNTMRQLSAFLKNKGFSAGGSAPFPELSNFALHYKEAEYALEFGRKDAAPITRFRDIACDFILETCISRLPASLLCAPEILKLRNYDAAHNSPYCKTLAAFLENDKNYTLTAKQLNIHRSTLLYRIDQINKISGLDITDTTKTWWLILSIKLLEKETSMKKEQENAGNDNY